MFPDISRMHLISRSILRTLVRMEELASPEDLEQILRAVHALDIDEDGPGRLAWIRELTTLTNAVDALISTLIAAHHDAENTAAPEGDRARYVPTEIALVRRITRSAAERETAASTRLAAHLPRTMAAWPAGLIDERAARAVASGARHLNAEQCRLLDHQLAPQLPLLKPGAITGRVETLVAELDPDGALDRARGEEAERRVTIRSAGNGMAYLSVYDTTDRITAEMKALKNAHEARQLGTAPVPGRGACYADAAFEKLTGLPDRAHIPLRIHVVMPASSLLGHTEHAANTDDGIPVPADLVRHWIRANRADVEFIRWLTDDTGHYLTATEQRGRYYTGHLRDFVTTRDGLCRGPNCSSPITQIDHATRWADGGATTASNAQGLCQACNLAKEAMTITPVPPVHDGGPPGYRWTTPNGLTTDSHPPPPAGDPHRDREWRLAQALHTMPYTFGPPRNTQSPAASSGRPVPA